MPRRAETITHINRGLQNLATFFIVMGFTCMCPDIVASIVEEKQSGWKELVRMAGLGNGLYWAAWCLTYMLFVMVLSTVGVFVLFNVQTQPMSYDFMLFAFITLVSFGFSVISFSFLIASLVNEHKVRIKRKQTEKLDRVGDRLWAS